MSTRSRIIQGDCNKVLQTLPAQSVDLIVTDPPYIVSYCDRTGRRIAGDDSPKKVLSSFAEQYRVLKPDSISVCFYGWSKVELFMGAWKDAGFSPVGHLVFRKRYASRVGYLKACHEQAYVLAKGSPPRPAAPISDVRSWEYSGNRRHPTEKAVSVLKPLIESFSDPGDLVLDPFAGSGSTAVAALLLDRAYIGIELERKYCNLARRRLAAIKEH
jgi:site-specific DNA-methyltransferase (adenine-specific)